MARNYIPVYFDLLDEAASLTDQEFGRMVRAAIMYARGIPEYMKLISGNERFVLPFIIGQIDRNNAISDARAKAGANKREQTQTNANKTEQKLTKQTKRKDEGSRNFQRFWDAYPRKVNKPGALRAFAKIDPDEALLEKMLSAIAKQKASAQWLEGNGQYIPHPATWLNGQRWEDEVQAAKPKKTVVAQDYEQRDYSDVQEELMSQLDREMEEFLGKQEGEG